jgi:hypothetical protein
MAKATVGECFWVSYRRRLKKRGYFLFLPKKKGIYFWVILIYVIRAHIKIPKNRNITFNNRKNLMFKVLNTP